MKRVLCIWLPGWADRRDTRALRRLALECQRFSPIVAVEEADRPESLLLDITGCSHLFGGEEGLARQTLDLFRAQGLPARVALADTIGAAWAASRFCRSPALVPAAGQTETLRPLPVEALRLPEPIVQRLHQFDIRRVGQLLALPRSSLPSRFGREVLLRLDQALGNVAELVQPEQAPEPIEASWAFDCATGDGRAVEAVLQQLLEQILQRLRPRQWGVLRLACTLKTIPAPEQEPSSPTASDAGAGALHLEVGLLRPSVSAGHLMELLRLQLERAGRPRARTPRKRSREQHGEVAAITLRAAVVVPLEFRQGSLFVNPAMHGPGQDANRALQLPALIERLSNRLGEKTILRPCLWPDAQPELACRYEPWLRAGRQVPPERSLFHEPLAAQGQHRPLCLTGQPLPIAVVAAAGGGPPRQLTWHNQQHVLAQCWGPERIETGWWRGQDIRRDYYLVETTTGRRFWIFRTVGSDAWFLHGLFG